jgi:hypothetical protein
MPLTLTRALAALGLVAFLMRGAGFFIAGGALAYPIDFDEGVYFSASALLFQGVHPYRDFVFVHPPGLLYLLGLFTALVKWLGVSNAFVATRWMAALSGGCSTFFAGRITAGWVGPLGGVAAALLYAFHPEAVGVERGPFLEPLLNVVCLSMANAWLAPREKATPWTFWLAALFCGLAISIKLWGGLWFLAALVSAPWRGPNFSRRLPFFLIAAVVVCVLVFPLALGAPESFLNQVFLFHAHRPPDGEVERWPRLVTLFSGIRFFISAGVLVALLVGLTNRRKRSREFLFFSTAYALTVGVFLASTSYWSQYNAHLAASECVLAGAGVAMLHRAIVEGWPRAHVWGGLFVVTVVVFPSLRNTVLYSWPKAPQQLAFGRALQQWAPTAACYFAFEPAWGVLGEKLPFHAASSPALVDVYATMLLDGLKDGARFSHVNDVFFGVPAQISIQNKLEHCRFVSLGGRGEWQLSKESKQWFYAHFVRRFPLGGEVGMDIWERTEEQ